MNLAISNIAWNIENNEEIYKYLKNINFKGIEIAPTKLLGEHPYNNLIKARTLSKDLLNKYNLKIISMQSIWYGRKENLFSSKEEKNILMNYTKQAINFASTIECDNLVLGAPKNRRIIDESDKKIAVEIFYELGEYAKKQGTILSIEANPILYGGNFINTTKEAIDLVKLVNSEGFKVNLDIGTIIYNNESIQNISDEIRCINHIHISEPNLKIIKERILHENLYNIIKDEYNKYISIEMGEIEDKNEIFKVMQYIKNIFK